VIDCCYDRGFTHVNVHTPGPMGIAGLLAARVLSLPLVATYHQSGVLRNPGYRREVWEDLKLLKSVLDEAARE
jgi:DNA polymerase